MATSHKQEKERLKCTKGIARNVLELEGVQQGWRVSRREICRKEKHGKYDEQVHSPLIHQTEEKWVSGKIWAVSSAQGVVRVAGRKSKSRHVLGI